MPTIGFIRRSGPRQFTVSGGIKFIASIVGSDATTSAALEAALNLRVDLDAPLDFTPTNNVGDAVRVLLTRWECSQVGDDDPCYHLTLTETRLVIPEPRANIVIKADTSKMRASITAAFGPCPECGPHGNKGRVLLLESWVDCLTCKGGA